MLKDVLKQFAVQIKLDLSKIFILYCSRALEPEDNEKTLIEIANQLDKKDKVMTLSAHDIDEEYLPEQKSSDEVLDIINNSRRDNSQHLIENRRSIEPLDPQFHEKKKFYLKNFIILIIQYTSIISLFALKYIPIIDEVLLEYKYSIIIYGFPPLIIITSIMSIVINECLQEDKTNKCMIIFLVFYPIFVIYCNLILSFYLDIKYIIIGLSFIFAEILSLGIYINIFKNYRLLFFGISSSLLSLIVLILFSSLLIKSLLPIVYVSIFWLITNGYFILWLFLSGLLCKLDESFYSVIIFNYSIFLGITKILALIFYGIKNLIVIIFDCIKNLIVIIFDFIKNRCEELDSTPFGVFVIFLIEHIIITIFVWVGFSFEWNSNIKYEKSTFNLFISLNIVIHFILCLILFLYLTNSCECINWCYGFHLILYIPIMCIYYYSFSFFIEEKMILSFIFKNFFSLLLIVLCIFITKTINFMMIFTPSFLMNIITTIVFHCLWQKDNNAAIYIPLFSFIFVDIYLPIAFNLGKKEYEFDIIFLSYGIFIVIFAIPVALIVGALYLLMLICCCICETIDKNC